MRRLFLSVFAVLVVATAGLAHAGTVSYQLVNRTDLSFDYSLRMANLGFETVSHQSYLGKRSAAELSVTPSIGPRQASSWQSYQVAPWYDNDGVGFDMLTSDGRVYELHRDGSYALCDLPDGSQGVNVPVVLEQVAGSAALQLRVYTPDGDACVLQVTPRGVSRGAGRPPRPSASQAASVRVPW